MGDEISRPTACLVRPARGEPAAPVPTDAALRAWHHLRRVPELYFAYGSNIDEHDMRARCPYCHHLGPAYLDDHRLAFTRRSIRTHTGVADIIPAAGHVVWGVLYELEERDLDALDHKEGEGWAYVRQRKRVRLASDGGERDAITYTVLYKELDEVSPSGEYLQRLVAAARDRGLPEEYVATLEAIHAVVEVADLRLRGAGPVVGGGWRSRSSDSSDEQTDVGDTGDPETTGMLLELAWDLGLRGLERQSQILGDLRGRTGTLLAGGGIMTSAGIAIWAALQPHSRANSAEVIILGVLGLLAALRGAMLCRKVLGSLHDAYDADVEAYVCLRACTSRGGVKLGKLQDRIRLLSTRPNSREWRVTLNERVLRQLGQVQDYDGAKAVTSGAALKSEATAFVDLVRRLNYRLIDARTKAFNRAAAYFALQLVLWVFAIIVYAAK